MRFRLVSTIPLLSSLQHRMMSTTPNRVAIIGGGLSGIMVGRSLLAGSSSIKPTIFEASSVGGLWSSSHDRMWDSMKTNLSKYTCSVSIQDWPSETPDFPTKRDVEAYIQNLAQPLEFLENTKVTRVDMLDTPSGKSYRVSFVNNTTGETSEDIFDKVVVTTGFFSDVPSIPFDFEGFHGRVIGSHSYRNPSSYKGKKVVLVGGSFSGCEVAAEIAKEAAEVHHIVSAHAYVVPTYLPENAADPATAFVPIDTAFYRLDDNRIEKVSSYLGNGAVESSSGFENIYKTEEEDLRTHDYLAGLLGTNNDVFHAAGLVKTRKARVVISDQYRRMVKSGKIRIHKGKLRKLSNDYIELTVPEAVDGSNSKQLAIAADECVFATGFQPDLSLLSEDIKTRLQIPTDVSADSEALSFMPFVLHKDIMHPDLPGLYFAGMYKGSYFGVIELQSNLVAAYIKGEIPLPTEDVMRSNIERMVELRNRRPRSQFPHPDYMGMMLDYAADLKRLPTAEFLRRHRIITPHHFSGNEAAVQAMEQAISLSRGEGKHVAKHVFQALEGESWAFRRVISDRKSKSAMNVYGKVSFTPIDAAGEYLLYKEEGKLVMANGAEFDSSHYYVYHYNSEQDTLDIFFSKVGEPEVIDRPFISMGFFATPEGWESKAYHLCGCDNYNSKYVFSFRGLSIPRFRVVFNVEGPAKDYTAETDFEIIEK